MKNDNVDRSIFKRQTPGFTEQAGESVAIPFGLLDVLGHGIDQCNPVPQATEPSRIMPRSATNIGNSKYIGLQIPPDQQLIPFKLQRPQPNL